MSTFVIGDVHGRRVQLHDLIRNLPRDPKAETLVILGDLIDRGQDIPGVVDDVINLEREAAAQENAPVLCLRGNHEQMLLDFVEVGADLWLHAAVGSTFTLEQYAERLRANGGSNPYMGSGVAASIPQEHLQFFRRLPLYYEDDFAIYVHAGLDQGKHPRDTESHYLMWLRDPEFFKHYRGKPCVFGHTPTPLLPLRGRVGRHGIYVSHNAIGIDTGYLHSSPLSCLQLPEFNVYQSYAGGRITTNKIPHHLIPEPFRVAGSSQLKQRLTESARSGVRRLRGK